MSSGGMSRREADVIEVEVIGLTTKEGQHNDSMDWVDERTSNKECDEGQRRKSVGRMKGGSCGMSQINIQTADWLKTWPVTDLKQCPFSARGDNANGVRHANGNSGVNTTAAIATALRVSLASRLSQGIRGSLEQRVCC